MDLDQEYKKLYERFHRVMTDVSSRPQHEQNRLFNKWDGIASGEIGFTFDIENLPPDERERLRNAPAGTPVNLSVEHMPMPTGVTSPEDLEKFRRVVETMERDAAVIPPENKFNYLGTSITRLPTIAGPFGQAWSVSLLPLGQRGKPDYDATLSMSIIRAPQSHPLWWMYGMSIIHLRPIDGVKPAHIKLTDATHELALYALNPEEPMPDLDAMERGDFESLHFLHPVNVVEQFQVPSDAHAWFLGETAVQAIVNGYISPDTDYRSQWTRAIAGTAQQLREGHYPGMVQ